MNPTLLSEQQFANNLSAAWGSNHKASRTAKRLSSAARTATAAAAESGDPEDHKEADAAHKAAAEAHVEAARAFQPGSPEHEGHNEIAADHAKNSWLHGGKHEGRLAAEVEARTQEDDEAPTPAPAAPAAPAKGKVPPQFAKKAAPAPAPAEKQEPAAEEASETPDEEAAEAAPAPAPKKPNPFAKFQKKPQVPAPAEPAAEPGAEASEQEAAQAPAANPFKEFLAKRKAQAPKQQAAANSIILDGGEAFQSIANEGGYAPDAETGLTRVQVAPYGDFPHSGGLQRFTKEDAKAVVNEWEGLNKAANPAKWMGVPWYIGHPDHPAFKDRYKDGRAYGRIKSLEAGNDGLYGMVKFNSLGKDLVNQEQFHGHSVNWRVRQDGNMWRPFSLKSVGFTNEPNIPVTPVLHANEGDDETVAGSSGDAELAGRAAQAYEDGENPASWVGDEDIWEKAKAAADKTYSRDDKAYWPSVVTIYKNMGGTVANEQARDEKGRFAAGEGVADADNSRRAASATLEAYGKEDAAKHEEARDAHRAAQSDHETKGNKFRAYAHAKMADLHDHLATGLRNREKQPKPFLTKGAKGAAVMNFQDSTANEVSLSDLNTQLGALLRTDARFQKDGEPESGTVMPSLTPWVADLVAPEAGEEQWLAIVQCGDGNYYSVGFTIEGGAPVLDEGEPEPVRRTTRYEATEAEEAANANPEGINQYTKVGGKTFAEHRDAAWKATDKAVEAQRNGDIEGAMLAHSDAANKHMDAHLQARNENVDTKNVKLAKRHFDAVNDHRKAYQKYKALYDVKVSANEQSTTGTTLVEATTGETTVKLNELAKLVGLDEAANETAITDRLNRVFGQPEVVAFANANPGDALPPWTAELEGWKTKFSDLEKKHADATKELGNCMESLKGTVKATGVANEAQLTSCGAMRQAAETALANVQNERTELQKSIVETAIKRGVIVLADKAKLESDLANSFNDTVLSLLARDPALRTKSMVNSAGVRSSNAAAAQGGDRVALMINAIQAEEKAMEAANETSNYDEAVRRAKAKQPALWETAKQPTDKE